LQEEFRARTEHYASRVIRFYLRLSESGGALQVLGRQLLSSATSVPDHVREASRARAEADFVSKLGGALRKVDESQLWLELLREDYGVAPSETGPIKKEVDELMAILTSIINHTKVQS